MRGWRSHRAPWDAPANELTLRVQRARATGARLFDLTVSNPTQTGQWCDPQELREILAATAALPYHPDPAGLRTAREALAVALSSSDDAVDAEDLFLCASTSEAYSWLFRIVATAGDTVLTPVPGYPLISALAELEELGVDQVSMDPERGRWSIPLAGIEERIASARLLCVVNPNNPTGNYIEGDEASGMLMLAHRRGVPVVSDEVFLDFSLDGTVRNSLARASEGLVFALGGLSKSLALPHWKLAWIRIGGDRNLRDEARRALEWVGDAYLSVSTPAQAALPGLLGMRSRIQQRLLDRLHTNLEMVVASLGVVPGVEVWRPQGGWSVVVRMPAVISDEDLTIRLVERCGVIVQPGYFFDLPWSNSFVLSLLPPPEVMEEGLARVSAEISRVIGA